MKDVQTNKSLEEELKFLDGKYYYIYVAEKLWQKFVKKISSKALAERVWCSRTKKELQKVRMELMSRLEIGDEITPLAHAMQHVSEITRFMIGHKAVKLRNETEWLYARDIDWINTVNRAGLINTRGENK